MYTTPIQAWTDTSVVSLRTLWAQLAEFLLPLAGALIVFVIGLIIASGLGTLVEKVITSLKIDSLLRKIGFEEYTRRAHVELNVGHFVGQVVYWFLVLAFLLAASDILGFYELSGFLRDILDYIPNLFIAILIMLASLVIANIVQHLVRASVMGARIHSGKFLASASWWVVVVFGMLTALVQLGIAVTIIMALLYGLIGMVALAGGLAFGLGGKEYASDILKEVREEFQAK